MVRLTAQHLFTLVLRVPLNAGVFHTWCRQEIARTFTRYIWEKTMRSLLPQLSNWLEWTLKGISMTCYSMECVNVGVRGVAGRKLERQTAVIHLGSCAVCVKVKGAAYGTAAVTGTLPRIKVSVPVCVRLLQSWLDRFLSCLSVWEAWSHGASIGSLPSQVPELPLYPER